MDVLPFVLPDGSWVIIDLPQGEFTGKLMGHGYQAQEMKYFVLLDDPTGFPQLPEGELVAVVPKDIVRVDARRLND